MKKLFLLLTTAIFITGCVPNFEKENEIVQETDDQSETSIIPNYQISDSHYRSMIPLVASKTRGLVVSNLHSRYDVNEFETGLMRVASEQFSPDKYVFQEGQYLERETVGLWLNRKFTEEQLEARKLSEEQNIGLNPMNEGKGTIEEQNEKNPIYLAHILEHNYLIKK